VNNEKNPDRLNPRLDPFDPKNGFKPEGASNYSEEFKAQAERMNRLIDDALELLQKIEAGKYIYTDDAPFNIPKFDGARLLSLEPSIHHTTLFPEKLLKNDGSIAVQIVESLAPSRPELAEANQTFSQGSREGLTVRSFLSSNAIRAIIRWMKVRLIFAPAITPLPACFSRSRSPCWLLAIRLLFKTSFKRSKSITYMLIAPIRTLLSWKVQPPASLLAQTARILRQPMRM
jgi:hypothetical protein